MPGLGSTRSVWDSNYSKSSAGNYANDKYIVMFSDDNRAIHITIQNINNEKLDNITSMVPSDTQIISSDEKDSDSMIINKHFVCTSELLKQVYPKSNGNFEVGNAFDRQSGKWIMSAISIIY